MKALRFFLTFCLVFTLTIPIGMSFEEKAYPDNYSDEINETITEGSFSFDDSVYAPYGGYGYSYEIDYYIHVSWTVDTTIGVPGNVGLTWNLHDSYIKITNTTPGKIAPVIIHEQIRPIYYLDPASRYGSYFTRLVEKGMEYVYTCNSQQGTSHLEDAGFWTKHGWYDKKYEDGSGSLGDNDTVEKMGIGETKTYDLEFMTSNGTSVYWNPTKTFEIAEVEVELFTNPIGWSFTYIGEKVDIPETYQYTPDAFQADNQQIELKFNVDDTSEVSINDYLIETAALECAVTYKGDSEVRALLDQMGWRETQMFSKDTSAQFFDHSMYWLSHQTRSDGVEVVSVLLKGTDGFREWYSALLNLWDPTRSDPDHFGFRTAAGDVIKEVSNYIDACGIDRTNVSFVIRGHSRGAAVGNVCAKELSDIYGKECVKAILLATPNVYWDSSGDPTYTNIVNIEDGGDIITKLPPGGSKNGTILGYDSDRGIIKDYYDVNSLLAGSFGAEDIFWTHTPENYLARIMSAEPQPEWNSSSWQLVGIHCETDIEVFDANGNSVASITDNIPGESNKYLILTNDDREKTIVLPTDGAFTVEITATADTPVEYSVHKLENGELTEYIGTETIDFANGDVRVAVFDGDSTNATLTPVSESIFSSSTDSGLSQNTFFFIVGAASALAVIVVIGIIVLIRRKKRRA